MNEALAQRLSINLIAEAHQSTPQISKQVIMHTKKTESPQVFTEFIPTNPSGKKTILLRSGDKSSSSNSSSNIAIAELNKNGIPIKNGLDYLGNPPTVKTGDVSAIIRIPPIECEAIYLREGMVYTWINRLVGYHLASKPRIVCKTDSEQKIMDSIISPSELRRAFKSIFSHEYQYGNHILKWNKEDNKIIGINWIDPKFFDAVRDNEGKVIFDSEGDPIGYIQYINVGRDTVNIPPERIVNPTHTGWSYQSGKTGILFLPTEIVQFKLNQLGDSWWGVGLIEPIYNFVKVKQNADEGFGEMMQRTGFPRIIAKVGDQTHPPTQEQIDDVWDKLSDLQTKQQFVGPYYYDFTILEPNKPDRFRFNLEYFQHGIVSGLGGPKPFITGIGGDTNRATLGDQKLWLERDLKNQQEDVSADFEEYVLKVIAKENNFGTTPTIVWDEVSTESLESKAERLVKLAKVGLIVPDDTLLAHIRDRESLPKIDNKNKEDDSNKIKGENDGEQKSTK